MSAHSRRSGRISRANVAAARTKLTDRDFEVLRAVEKVRLLQATQVERLLFTDGSTLTQARRCRAVLERLTHWGCLTRMERRIGGVRAGSAGFVYALAPVGQRILHPGADTLRRVREPSRPFVDHTLAISELWVQLSEAERMGEVELVSFDAEPTCWRSFPGLGGERQWLKPDAYLVTASGEYEDLAFVEVDLGTESATVLRAKADAYVRYWQSGLEQHRSGAFPTVVFLVPDDRRRATVVSTLGRLPPEHWQLFQVGLLDEAVATLVNTNEHPIERR